MKVGSLVLLIKPFELLERKNHEIRPEMGVIYTIREIRSTARGVGITLEEIVNPMYNYQDGYNEVCFNIEKFREIQPPMDISELITETVPHECA